MLPLIRNKGTMNSNDSADKELERFKRDYAVQATLSLICCLCCYIIILTPAAVYIIDGCNPNAFAGCTQWTQVNGIEDKSYLVADDDTLNSHYSGIIRFKYGGKFEKTPSKQQLSDDTVSLNSTFAYVGGQSCSVSTGGYYYSHSKKVSNHEIAILVSKSNPSSCELIQQAYDYWIVGVTLSVFLFLPLFCCLMAITCFFMKMLVEYEAWKKYQQRTGNDLEHHALITDEGAIATYTV